MDWGGKGDGALPRGILFLTPPEVPVTPHTFLPLFLLLTIPSQGVAAQAGPPVTTLSRADRVLAEPFSQVAGARELADGRLVVSDRVEDRVVVVDPRSGALTRVGRAGSGPAEYRRPGRLMPMLGDSLLLADEGNERLLVIAPDLKIVRTLRLDARGVPVGLSPRGVDPRGRFYCQVPHWAAGSFGDHGDSVPLVRVTPGDPRAEIITWVLGIADPPGNVRYGMPYVPFSPADGWALAPDGTIVMARVGDYHIERLKDGAVERGPATPFRTLPVTLEDKVAYTREFMENSGVGGRGTGGASVGSMPAEWLTDAAIRHVVETNLYAATKPPFTDRPPLLAPDGTLWVERSTVLGAPASFDLFDRTGRVTRTVILPSHRRLLMIGRGGVYLVATDEDGVERVERYQL